MAKNIVPRSQDYSQWYLDVIAAAELADYAPVRGCMVIRPLGYALWEAFQRELDRRFKALGHVNAYFPLFIPESFLRKEAEHVEGFAPECAVVTHGGGERLEEPLVIRPTSETIIGHMYAQWIHSWRDLPVLINQWANVVRWERRTRLFLRTMEFLWQEGHTAHETAEEAQEETLRMLQVYREFAEEVLAVPVLVGQKTDSEKFAGAVRTYCIEGMMQDGKALQMGTSHNLGQNFSKAFDIRFEGRDQSLQHVWTTSWGVSTRLIGGMIMAHSDDEGLVIPPRVAPTLAVFIPISRTDEERERVLAFIDKALVGLVGDDEVQASRRRFGAGQVPQVFYHPATNQVLAVDRRDTMRPGEKHYFWEQRGVPLRIEVGPRDCDAGQVVVKSRLDMSKEVVPLSGLTRSWLDGRLEGIQKGLFERARSFRDANIQPIASYDELKEFFRSGRGFARCRFLPDPEAEAAIKAETKATVRTIPFDQPGGTAPCIYSGRPTDVEVIFGIAY
ncbi:MAG TPA: His/Gly/Thr/Pro-type tRNA ligase C-terminal domain-containing protein [Myxococcota bacterium]|nr:His/Gly/Thr/Pro-type tRNA ligase C-terminal domain-containing protein [Myxococcota bacterium]HQK51732.1 His/Gly/Thr/Pro-type tRNA ligase C-terminal domain-containing protein [Myxococcota bacterium]